MKKLLPLLILPLFFGCARLSPFVNLKPDLTSEGVKVQGNPALYISVQDQRTDKTLGVIPGRKGEAPIQVMSEEPIINIIRLNLTEGLTRSGFLIATLPDKDFSSLVVNLTKLTYQADYKAASTVITVNGELQAAAKNGEETRTKTFKVENGKTWAFTPPSSAHEEYLNLALSELINSLLTDEKFLSFLAEKNK